MTATSSTKTTPMMAQWETCKEQAKDAVLLFRMGDFYEAFYEDAEVIAKSLDLTLTKRQDVPMSGVPCHTCETYIDRLVAKGFKVAVAEQIEDPKQAKGLVKREVTRVVTPATVINSSLLQEGSNNFFAALTQVGSIYGLAFLDLTTADFALSEFDRLDTLLSEIYRLQPKEFLVSRKFHESHQPLFNEISHSFDHLLTKKEEWQFGHELTHNFLLSHFGIHSLDGFGLNGMTAGIHAAGALLQHIQEQLCLPVQHIQTVAPYTTDNYLSLDKNSQRNLELTESLNDHSRKHTLLEVLDRTCTPMGARLMRHWVKQPLIDKDEIKRRQDVVALFYDNQRESTELKRLMDQIRDLERVMMKIMSGYASPRDLTTLRFSLEPLPDISQFLSILPKLPPLLKEEAEQVVGVPELTRLIAKCLVDDPPAKVSDGKLIRAGFHQELDELREISRNSKEWIANYQTSLREETGIKTLKVGFNRMFGYYIEVSKGQTQNMPECYERRQTLVNSERYISPELKEYESKVLTAEEKISTIEVELFHLLVAEVRKYSSDVQKIAHALSKIDCLRSLGDVARERQYVRPTIDHSRTLHIVEGRHPVIEAAPTSEQFIPNDTFLDDSDNRLLVITGPNMAGKSTYIRQVALITIMAQMGGFVPAQSAHIGIVDKVFTRIGASDDLSRGHSTFMVEMTEAANILNNATSRSLVILDEIGRGTSTYDGISIAWSVAEYLLTCEDKMAKTLFATHYFELTKLEERVPGAVNYNVAVHETSDSIRFLRKIVKGGADRSYGIHVARLAGLPKHVLDRAQEILVHLEENGNEKDLFAPSAPKQPPKKQRRVNDSQMSLF